MHSDESDEADAEDEYTEQQAEEGMEDEEGSVGDAWKRVLLLAGSARDVDDDADADADDPLQQNTPATTHTSDTFDDGDGENPHSDLPEAAFVDGAIGSAAGARVGGTDPDTKRSAVRPMQGGARKRSILNTTVSTAEEQAGGTEPDMLRSAVLASSGVGNEDGDGDCITPSKRVRFSVDDVSPSANDADAAAQGGNSNARRGKRCVAMNDISMYI